MQAALYTLFLCWVFWHGFIHSMGLYRAKLKGRLVGGPLLLSLPVIFVTFILDLLAQFTVASLLFWRFPEGVGFKPKLIEKFGMSFVFPWWPVGDWLVTYRLRRYIAAGPEFGRRYRMAEVICRRWVDPFDPTGAHCDSEPPVLSEARS